MILIKIIQSYREIVAICDSELLNKKFYEGKFQLDVKESFFGGEETSEEEVIKIMQNFSREDATFTIIGEKSVNCAIKAGIIPEDGFKKIDGVPFALVLL
ncbi:DUF424 family protein [Candidatus Pacearchaeota archaeon]|nr:DUF424 family protein [Candidatus Pacearchaeota archaeon]